MGILIASGNKGGRHTSHSPTRNAVLLRGRGTLTPYVDVVRPLAGHQASVMLNHQFEAGMAETEKKENQVGGGESPSIKKEKEDTLAQKSRETPPPQKLQITPSGNEIVGILDRMGME
eukprot:495055-Pelagomonas_calceolata.AAC.1